MLAQAASNIYLFFGRHAPRYPRGFIEHLQRTNPSEGRKVFVGELGGITLSALREYLGDLSAAHAFDCIQKQNLDERLKKDINTCLDDSYKSLHKGVQEILDFSPSESDLKRLSAININLVYFLVAAKAGYEIDEERITPEIVFNQWLAQALKNSFLMVWQGVYAFYFDGMLDLVKAHYNFLYDCILKRDINFGEQLLIHTLQYDFVSTHRGIAHSGFFKRVLPGARIVCLCDPYFSEIFLSEDIKPENLTKYHMAQIIKEFVYELICEKISVSSIRAYQLANKLPDDLSDLEKFLKIFNERFLKSKDPLKVIREVVSELL